MPADVAENPAGVTLERFQRLAHSLELPCMGVSADLDSQPGCFSCIGLPQVETAFPGQGDQLCPRPLVEPRIRGMGDVLFHDRRIDGNAGEAGVVHRARRSTRLDGLGQQPFRPFLADPVPPPA